MKDLTIYNVYVEMESQEQCDRMKKLCIDNNLPIWENEVAFYFFEKATYVFSYFGCEFFVENLKSILMKKQTEVTEQEFIGLLKKHKSIENNNGWIKIESEEDLPKDEENLDYWVMEDEQIVHAKFMPDSKRWYCDIDLNLRLFPSHYQPVVKPKPPIY